jgi:N-acetylmuramic acid 6-phosphate etherase
MNEHVDLTALQSEGRNPRTLDIDVVDTIELCRLINDEDKAVPLAVEQCLPAIASAIDALTGRVRDSGRVIYTGAGTSGRYVWKNADPSVGDRLTCSFNRLGVLDASELPPTFSADPAQFVAIIAGGDTALRHAVEGAEDDREQAAKDLRKLRLGDGDCLIGIAASGRTPYVLSCLSYAKALGCLTVGISCSSPSAMLTSGHVDHMIEAVSGPEVISGSTRLKAGTATKLVLNMLSTGVHIRLGKTYSNLVSLPIDCLAGFADDRCRWLTLEQRIRS